MPWTIIFAGGKIRISSFLFQRNTESRHSLRWADTFGIEVPEYHRTRWHGFVESFQSLRIGNTEIPTNHHQINARHYWCQSTWRSYGKTYVKHSPHRLIQSKNGLLVFHFLFLFRRIVPDDKHLLTYSNVDTFGNMHLNARNLAELRTRLVRHMKYSKDFEVCARLAKNFFLLFKIFTFCLAVLPVICEIYSTDQ